MVDPAELESAVRDGLAALASWHCTTPRHLEGGQRERLIWQAKWLRTLASHILIETEHGNTEP